MDFRTHEDLEIRYYTDEWAPFYFDFVDSIPSGSVLSAVTVEAYSGKVTPRSDLAAETEVTATIIDGDYVPTILDDTFVVVKFQYAAARKGEKATLIFKLTLDTGGMHPFYFYPVKVM